MAAEGAIGVAAAVTAVGGAPASHLSDQTIGLVLATSSGLFIGSSFIIKKKGLRRAGTSGIRAGSGGYSYLLEPLWWAGMATMVLGEVANFAAYAFAPAILVTPLGALSIIVSAILAHYLLGERLNVFGVLGCVLCITGSLAIVLHAPQERPLESVVQVWSLAMQPGFLLYSAAAVAATLHLIFRVSPEAQAGNVLVYVAICSVVGSLSVMSCKALGVAFKLTFEGQNQLIYPQTYLFTLVVAACVVTQMNYLNKALDLFNTAIVTPIYYVMFTTATITASMIMFREEQGAKQVLTEASGFLTIICGTILLHTTKDLDLPLATFAQLMLHGGVAAPRGGGGEEQQRLNGLELGGGGGGGGAWAPPSPRGPALGEGPGATALRKPGLQPRAAGAAAAALGAT